MYIVLGGELKDLEGPLQFRDCSGVEFVGAYPTYDDAVRAWRARAQQTVDAGQPLDVNLTRPVPVYFVYITAWAERDGEVEFRPDIYGRDGAADQVAEMDRDPGEPAPAITLAP